MTEKQTENPTSLRKTNIERKKELSSALKANMRRRKAQDYTRKGQDHLKKDKKDG